MRPCPPKWHGMFFFLISTVLMRYSGFLPAVRTIIKEEGWSGTLMKAVEGESFRSSCQSKSRQFGVFYRAFFLSIYRPRKSLYHLKHLNISPFPNGFYVSFSPFLLRIFTPRWFQLAKAGAVHRDDASNASRCALCGDVLGFGTPNLPRQEVKKQNDPRISKASKSV